MAILVILAAGLGSRFGGNKQLAKFSSANSTKIIYYSVSMNAMTLNVL
jgi:CTP:molybdopterin cytidylyltransferase MocA